MEFDTTKWLPEVVLSALGGLILMVRGGDARRITALEERVESVEFRLGEGAKLLNATMASNFDKTTAQYEVLRTYIESMDVRMQNRFDALRDKIDLK